jgi:hypothetical protein
MMKDDLVEAVARAIAVADGHEYLGDALRARLTSRAVAAIEAARRFIRADALEEAAKVLDPVITSGGVTLPNGRRRPMTTIEIELQNSNNRRKAAAIRALGEK